MVIVVVAIALVIDLAPVPAWIIIGIVLAMALDPLVEWLIDHTALGRGAAVGAVVVGLLAIVVAMLVFAVPSIVDSVRDLDDQLPGSPPISKQLPLIGDELAERGVADRLQTTLEESPDRLASDTGPMERTLRSVGDGLVATFWILLITVTGADRRPSGPRRSAEPVARQPRERFERVDTIVGDIVARYAVGSLVIAVIAGTGGVHDRPGRRRPAGAIARVVGGDDELHPAGRRLPRRRPARRARLTTGTSKGLIILAIYLIYMQIENRIIQPVIVSKAVDIPPFVAMVAVLVGGAAAGVVGAVLVTPLVGVAKSLLNRAASAPTGPGRGRAARRG